MSPTATDLGVSRETFERLDHFVALLGKWSPRINLVAKSTLETAWQRHVVDSIQVFRCLDSPADTWADLGSGGGLPGLVVAILSAEAGNPAQTILVESDQRKSAFLRTVLRETGCPGKVISERIEDVPALGAQVLSARALADLGKLLAFSERHLAPGGTCLFPKGKNWKSELQSAQEAWHFWYDAVPSQTDSQAVILKIRGLARA